MDIPSDKLDAMIGRRLEIKTPVTRRAILADWDDQHFYFRAPPREREQPPPHRIYRSGVQVWRVARAAIIALEIAS